MNSVRSRATGTLAGRGALLSCALLSITVLSVALLHVALVGGAAASPAGLTPDPYLSGDHLAGERASIGPHQGAGCEVQADQQVRPPVVAVGAEATISMTVSADCSDVNVPFNAVLLFDNSVAMGGTRMNYMRDAVRTFAEAVDPDRTKVGLVAYHFAPEILSPLTSDFEALAESAQAFFPRQGSNLTAGVRAAVQVLEDGREPGVEREEVLVLLVGSENDGGADEAIAVVDEAKAQGMTVIAVAGGPEADVEMLEAMASSAGHFHSEGAAVRLPSLFGNIAGGIGSVQLAGAQVTTTLPGALSFVFGSSFPVPRVQGKDLTWQFGVWPPDGLAIEFGVASDTVGEFPVSEGAEVRLTFDRGQPVTANLPIPTLRVESGPTVTPTPLPSTATPTPTPRTLSVFLPLVFQRHCQPPRTDYDLVFLIDTSASGLAPAGDGVRLDAVLRGAAASLDRLDYRRGRAAIVAFADQPVVLQGLTTNRGALVSTLARLYAHIGTASRAAPAIDLAGQLLGQDGRPGAVVLVTDGLDDGPEARTRGEDLQRAGVKVILVGLGAPETDNWDVSHRLTALTPGEMESAVGQVAGAVGCVIR